MRIADGMPASHRGPIATKRGDEAEDANEGDAGEEAGRGRPNWYNLPAMITLRRRFQNQDVRCRCTTFKMP